MTAFLVMCGADLYGPRAAFAQTNTGEISGVVVDAQGGVLPGAVVIAEHLESGTRVERVSDEQGRFLLPSLRVGAYTITVDLPGFKHFVRQGVVLQLGQKVDLTFHLEIGISEEVTVTTEAPLIQTANAEVSQVITNEQVVQLPLNGRQFLQLALLTDNVVVPPGGTRGAALQQAGTLFNVAGQRSGHNIYLLDGVKVTDEYFNNMVVSLSPDAIQEFKITKSQYPAEFGGKAAALVNVATRSGTNRVTGAVVEFVRNSAFDSHNYFDDPSAPVPPLRQHQYGASFGGPLRRDRSFIFANYEGQRIRKSTTQTFSVPTAALRAGDFSALGPLCDPVAAGAAAGCVSFANSRIPANRIDPVARAFLEKVPLPNEGGTVQNLRAVAKQRADMDQFSLRLDHRLGDSDQIYGRVTFYDVNDDQPFGTSALNETLVPGFGRDVTTTSRNAALGHNHVFSASIVNELRFGYLGVGGGQFSQNRGVDFAALADLNGVTRDPRDVGYPQISFAGLFSTVGDPTSFTTRDNTSYEIYENFLVQRGSHTFKAGGYLFYLKFRPESPDNARGAFTFTGQFTGNAFADFLLGYPTAAVAGIGRAEEDARTTWLHLYAQDDWRISPNLTLNAGLRTEINRHITDTRNRLSSIDLAYPGGRYVVASDDRGTLASEARALLPLIPLPVVTSKDAGWDASLLRPSYRRFAPRVGLVWRLPDDSQTVVRTAYGIFLNQWAYSVQQAFARNLPFFLTKSVNVASDVRVPTFTTATMLTSPELGTIGGSIMDWDYRVEYNRTYTLDVERQLGGRTSAELSFMASRTIGADSSTIHNVPLPGPGSIADRRPIPQLGPITAIRWNGWGRYHSATLRLEHRVREGLSIGGNYTWSKSMDDASDPGATTHEANLPQNVYDLRAESALSSYHHAHRFVANGTYGVPWPARLGGWRGAIGANWRISGIVTLESGAPFTVNLGTDRANVGAGPAQRPNVSGDPNLKSGRDAERWFDTSVFSLPAPFTFGNAGRNIVFGPGFANVDAVFQKEARISDRVRLELRWEIFNLLNRTNFNIPNRIAFTPNFGRIFSANSARQMQLGARLTF
jgi:hypothetical protein